MTIPQTHRMACGCLAHWNDLEGQYIGHCTCPPEKRRAMRLAERRALQQAHDERKRREESPLAYRPFCILRYVERCGVS